MKKLGWILFLTIITTAIVSTTITFSLFKSLSADLVPAQEKGYEANFVKKSVKMVISSPTIMS